MHSQARRAKAPSSMAPAATLRALAQGQLLCREGDPPGALYVICSGSVRAYRDNPTRPDRIQELATLGPGDIVGELAPMLQRRRAATVEALELTEVLEVPAVHVHTLLRQHKSLLRVLALALRDRAGLTASEVESIVTREGLRLPVQVLEAERAEGEPLKLPAPMHDPSMLYAKAMSCPVCGTQFSALVVHPQKDQPYERSSDFHQRYRTTLNPYDYEVWVCPNDLYAALPVDFGDISELQRPRVAEVVESVVAEWEGYRPDFNVERTFELREQSLQLALALYRMRGASPLRIAAVAHRLAWCARERNDVEGERKWLAQALHAYSTAYNQSDLDSPKVLLRVVYLCGELNARLGDTNASARWFGEGLRHPQIKEHPNWDRMMREQWSAVRAAPETLQAPSATSFRTRSASTAAGKPA